MSEAIGPPGEAALPGTGWKEHQNSTRSLAMWLPPLPGSAACLHSTMPHRRCVSASSPSRNQIGRGQFNLEGGGVHG
jgi:hypothetical protein